MRDKFPNFFIVGVPKSGSSSLHKYLSLHPQIFMSKSKEPMFFAVNDLDLSIIKRCYLFSVYDKNKYLSLFSDSKNEKIRGESSIMYYYFYPFVYENMRKFYGANYKDNYLLMVVRNPAERLISHFLFDFLLGKGKYVSFIDIFYKYEEIKKIPLNKMRFQCLYGYDYIGMSKYSESMSFFKRKFKDNFYVVLYDQLKNEYESTLKKIFKFLDVEVPSKMKLRNKRYNRGFGRYRSYYLYYYYSSLFKIERIMRRLYVLTENKIYKALSRAIYYYIISQRPLVFSNKRDMYLKYIKELNNTIFYEDIIRTEKILNFDISSLWL